MLDANYIRSVIDYNAETGEMVWRESFGRRKQGEPVGHVESNGYVRVTVCGTRIRRHQLAWLYVYGKMPDGEIDHINGVYGDDRLCNLRDVSHAENLQNRTRPQANNSTGLIGVVPNKNRYSAMICRNGKTAYLGTFGTPEEAHAVYMQARGEQKA